MVGIEIYKKAPSLQILKDQIMTKTRQKTCYTEILRWIVINIVINIQIELPLTKKAIKYFNIYNPVSYVMIPGTLKVNQ